MTGFFADLRYALRSLAKNPGFTAVAVATLGLGLGANTAIFSLVDVLYLRPLAVADSARLVHVYQSVRGGTRYASFSMPDYFYYRDNASARYFETLGFLSSRGGTSTRATGRKPRPWPS